MKNIKYFIYFILFIILSPGIILNLPSINNKYFFTNKTNLLCAFIHSIIFAIIIYLLNNCLYTKKIMNEHFTKIHKNKKEYNCLNILCKSSSDCINEFNKKCCHNDTPLRTICFKGKCDCG
jgi:hypothetical protein